MKAGKGKVFFKTGGAEHLCHKKYSNHWGGDGGNRGENWRNQVLEKSRGNHDHSAGWE